MASASFRELLDNFGTSRSAWEALEAQREEVFRRWAQSLDIEEGRVFRSCAEFEDYASHRLRGIEWSRAPAAVKDVLPTATVRCPESDDAPEERFNPIEDSDWIEVYNMVHQAGGPRFFTDKLKTVRLDDFLECASLLTRCGLVRAANETSTGTSDGYRSRLRVLCEEIHRSGGASEFTRALQDVPWETLGADMVKIERWKEDNSLKLYPESLHFLEWFNKLKSMEGKAKASRANSVIATVASSPVSGVLNAVIQFLWKVTQLSIENAQSRKAGVSLDILKTIFQAMDKDFVNVIDAKELPLLKEALSLVMEQRRRGGKLKQGLKTEFDIGPTELRGLVYWLKKFGGIDQFLRGAKFIARCPMSFPASCELASLIHEVGLSHITRAQWQCLAIHFRKHKPDMQWDCLRSQGSFFASKHKIADTSWSLDSMPSLRPATVQQPRLFNNSSMPSLHGRL